MAKRLGVLDGEFSPSEFLLYCTTVHIHGRGERFGFVRYLLSRWTCQPFQPEDRSMTMLRSRQNPQRIAKPYGHRLWNRILQHATRVFELCFSYTAIVGTHHHGNFSSDNTKHNVARTAYPDRL